MKLGISCDSRAKAAAPGGKPFSSGRKGIPRSRRCVEAREIGKHRSGRSTRITMRAFSWLSGPILAIAFLWLSFRGVELDVLWGYVGHADPLLLALSLTAVPTHVFLRSWRWRSLLMPIRARVPLKETYSATAIGYLAGLLPAKLGEVVRPAVLSRRLDLPFAPTLATVGVERAILDLLVVLLMGAVGLLLPPTITGIDPERAPEWLPRFQRAGAVLLGVALLALFGVHFVGRKQAQLSARLGSVAARTRGRILPALIRWVRSLLPGFTAMKTWKGLFALLGQSVLVWGMTAAGIHAGIRACGLELSPAGTMILIPILVAGLVLFPTPGNTGTFHLAMKLGLVSLFGVEETSALGTGLVVHLCNWIPLIVLGTISVGLGGLRGSPKSSIESRLSR